MQAKLDFEMPTLIQSVQVAQALMEAGVTVSIDKGHEHIYKYLGKFFKSNYTFEDAPIANITMSHPAPFVRVGNIERPLLYPHAIGPKLLKVWNKRRHGILFLGLIPPHRKVALKRWDHRATILATKRGRKGVERYWDERYFTLLGKAEFVLCPNGGYPWSMRFFEAALCGATPIVQTECDIYKGFYYHRWRDTALTQRHVQENFNLALERLTIPHQQILDNLF